MVRLMPGTAATQSQIMPVNTATGIVDININYAKELPAIVVQPFNDGDNCNIVVFTPLNGAVSMCSVPAAHMIDGTPYTGPYFKAAPCPIP